MPTAIKKELYKIENVVRKQITRLHRAKSATRHRFKQFVGGHRVARGEMLTLSAEQFAKYEKEVLRGLLSGELAVRMPDGTRVTTTVDGRFFVDKPGSKNMALAKGAPPPWAKSTPAKAEPIPTEIKVEPVVEPTPVVEEQEEDISETSDSAEKRTYRRKSKK